MISQINPPPAEFVGYAIAFGFGCIAAIAAVLSIVRGGSKQKRIIEPDPVRVQKIPDFVTMDFCGNNHITLANRIAEHDAAISAIRADMKVERETAESSARVRSTGIYNKIDDVRKELTAKQDELQNQMTRGFNDMERAIGRLEGPR